MEIWGKNVPTVEAEVGSPYGEIQHVMAAAKELSNKDVDIIVMDCIGYTVQMKDIVSKITGKPVIHHSQTIDFTGIFTDFKGVSNSEFFKAFVRPLFLLKSEGKRG